MRVIKRLGDKVEHYIRSYVIAKLHQQRYAYRLLYRNDIEGLKRVLRPGDVILVEGEHLVSDWIKVFSYHTWTHSALWVGDNPQLPAGVNPDFVAPKSNMVEALMGIGVVLSDLDKYRDYNLRICRPIGLSRTDIRRAIRFALDHIGSEYDQDNVSQFVHFSFEANGDPTSPIGHLEDKKFTCSSLIAAAFETVGLPTIQFYDRTADKYIAIHATQVQPKDFDLSLNFDVIKSPALLAQLQKPGMLRRLVSSVTGARAV